MAINSQAILFLKEMTVKKLQLHITSQMRVKLDLKP